MKPTTLHTLLFTILFSAVSIFSANAQLTYSGGACRWIPPLLGAIRSR